MTVSQYAYKNRKAVKLYSKPKEGKMTINVGDIFVSTWGYDQTNKTFYQVIALTAKTAKLGKLKDERTYNGQAMTGEAMPIRDSYEKDAVFTKKIKQSAYGGKPCFMIEKWEYARPWDGKPEHYTSYA